MHVSRLRSFPSVQVYASPVICCREQPLEDTSIELATSSNEQMAL